MPDQNQAQRPDAQSRRLAAVDQLGLLDRIGDPVLTTLARLARSVSGASSVAVHVFDADFQHRVAGSGVALGDHPAADSMCRLVIESGEQIVTNDATADARFAYSSFVKAPVAPVRFYASLPLRNGGGVVVGTLCAFDSVTHELNPDQLERLQDIAQLVCAHLELMRIANELGQAAALDPLTGVVNRVIFDDRLARALARRRRRGTPVVVALIDLDNFKSVNDTHGHSCGDAALQWVARRLSESVRTEDTVGRIGGDEFAVVAEVSDPESSRLADKLQRAPEGFTVPLSISVGTVVADDNDDVESLLQRADRAMYAHKLTRRR